MNTIGIIGAMESETDHLIRRMTATDEITAAGRRFVRGTLAGRPAVVVQSGIGKVAAAVTAQMLIDRFAVEAIINTGMAGGLDPRLAVGDLVIGTAAVQHDFDLTAFGHAPGYICGSDDTHATAFVADAGLVARALEAAGTVLPQGSKAITGVIASGDVFVSDDALREQIRCRFGAAAAEMEGAAIAQTADANGVPFLILRTISDLAGRQAEMSFAELERYAGRLAGDMTAALLGRL